MEVQLYGEGGYGKASVEVASAGEVLLKALTGELGVLPLGEDFGVLCGIGPFPVGVVEMPPVPGADDELRSPVSVPTQEVEFEAVTGDPEDDGETPVPVYELTLLTVMFLVEVSVLVKSMVEEEDSSVQLVVYTEVEFEFVTGDDAVELAWLCPDGRIDEKVTVVGTDVTRVSVVELLDLTGPEDTPNECGRPGRCTVTVCVTGIVTTVVRLVVYTPVPVGPVGWAGVKLPDELV
jgi:hypothetical protein